MHEDLRVVKDQVLCTGRCTALGKNRPRSREVF